MRLEFTHAQIFSYILRDTEEKKRNFREVCVNLKVEDMPIEEIRQYELEHELD